MNDLKINYIELSSDDIPASKAFMAQAFGWTFQDYGPGYQAFDTVGSDGGAGLDGGLDGSGDSPAGTALVVLKTDDLEGALARVTAAGGRITKPIFAFPGGRRFQFTEPGGTILAVWSES